MIEVTINQQVPFGHYTDELLARMTQVIHEHTGVEGSVSLGFVDNDTMQELNRTYYGIDAPTDVLSFPEADLSDEEKVWLQSADLLGEIIIATEVLAEQAPKYGNNEEQEFVRLFVHGFLHLIGYDHAEPTEAAEMKQHEEQIINKIYEH